MRHTNRYEKSHDGQWRYLYQRPNGKIEHIKADEYHCLGCGKLVIRITNQLKSDRIFCSEKCKFEAGNLPVPAPQTGAANPAWKGGRIKHKSGYVLVRRPDHPANNNGYVPEHRLVMEQYIGRHLLPQETVHHKNGKRSDNRLENLELWCSSHPPGQRVADLVTWAKEILNTYDILP